MICTPSRPLVPWDQRPATIKHEEDDQTSVFSMTRYGSLDWDHSGDEFEFQRHRVTPKPKRRPSTVSLSREGRALYDMEPGLPTRRRPRSTSYLAGSAERPLQLRDENGRFARRKSAASEVIPAAQKSRSRSKSMPETSAKTSLQLRDRNGRFARNPPVTNEVSPTIPKDENLCNASESSKKSSSQKRDAKGRFSKTPSKTQPLLIPELPLPEAELATRANRKRQPATSPYFIPLISPSKAAEEPKIPKIKNESSPPKSTPKKRSPGGTVSCIPFPPLSTPYFGLIQEKLAHDPFRLLIAVTFLIRTHGKHAIPVFYELMNKYPTPESLVAADKDDIVPIIHHLGLQNQRASTYQMYAKLWLENPPAKGKRYAVRDYPTKGSGRDIKKDDILSDEDERVAWEIGHMTQGPYAIDSWRIFCRDVLRGVATGWNGEGSDDGFQPEWMRVLPEDKELRACLRWMWLKEGFEWNPFTGAKEVASPELLRAAMEGRIAWDDRGGMRILDHVIDGEEVLNADMNGEITDRGVDVKGMGT